MFRPRLVWTAVLLLAAASAGGLWSWHQSEAALPGAEPETSGGADTGVASSPAASIYPRPAPGLNLLALEPSPYLQLHSHNPVDWHPWGEAAFERARATGRPVFLSVGYSTCYWCHVMEREVFSDPEIAALMNANFISIKVDREERPDIDDIYMRATHLLTGSGGWPNSVFLTPDGRPFFAGTYFPPVERPGRRGFPGILRELHDAWSESRANVEGVADRVTERLAALADPAPRTPLETPPVQELMRDALRDLAASYEPQHGGFSRTIKFPRPPALELLATSLERETNPARLELLTHTLDEMALGGIYDQLGGGFHRYVTEPTWSIPHFEKMLYDNGQLLGIYAQAYALTGRPLYRRIVEETARYLDREMSLPEGGFASAQDAEVHAEEGASYVWRRAGIEAVLGKQRAAVFLGVYELAPLRASPASGVLRVQLAALGASDREHARDAAALLARFDADRAALLEARAERDQSLRDDKVLVAWNALAIRGLVQAAAALDQPVHLERAKRAARFLLARLRAEDGSLRRSYIAGQAREQGVLDDYAFLADALLALHGATGEPTWLAEARRLADAMLVRFLDPRDGGLFLTPADHQLLVRPKPFDEGDRPSGNAVALRALLGLAETTGDARYAEAAAGIAASAAGLLREAPSALPTLVAALSRGKGEAHPKTRLAARREQAGAAASAAAEFRLPRSEDHVHARVARVNGAPDQLVVRVSIDPGWHVHANPASLAFLIPTALELGPSGEGAVIRYPEGRALRPEFTPDSILVYDGDVEIAVRLRAGAAPPARMALRYQACDERLCLPPGRSELALAGPLPLTREAAPPR